MSKGSIKAFNPERVASLDTQMLQAYYSHKFFKMFRLLIRLFREQMGTGYLADLRLAYYSARAAMVFRRTGNLEQTEALLTKFYALVDKHSIESVDAKKTAKAELNYWLVHRYPKRYKQSLAQAVSEAKAVFYNVSPESLKEYGQHYVAATSIRDKATHVDHVEPDWQAMQKHFEQAYISLYEAVNQVN